jgi:gamma-glutamyltranspeptidase / glutathione hydrolase
MTKRLGLILAVALAASPVAQQKDHGVPSKDGLVVCTSAPACDAGRRSWRRGATPWTPRSRRRSRSRSRTRPPGNIGGGGFMIVRTPDGEVTSFDYRERAPLASTRTMYLDKDGNIDASLTRAGYLAPGVPGSVRGLAMAHAKFGKLPGATSSCRACCSPSRASRSPRASRAASTASWPGR